MSGPSSFQKDLASGKAAEQRIANKLLEAGMYSSINFIDGNFIEYDAIAKTAAGDEERLEMKNDMKSALTGNFFVEFWCRDKPSGIAASQADFYMVTTHNPMQFWKLPVKYLKDVVKGCRVVSGGDNNVAQGYLVPVSKLAKEYKMDFGNA
jgi:hypothetical protein